MDAGAVSAGAFQRTNQESGRVSVTATGNQQRQRQNNGID